VTQKQTPHQSIIKRFGSLQDCADAMNKARPNEKPVAKSHVQYWHDSGLIPSKYHSAFMYAGRALKPKLKHSDFFEKG
jgi:hypothetical protein